MTTLKRYKLCDDTVTLFQFDVSPYLNAIAISAVSADPTGFTAQYDFNGNLYGYLVDWSAASHTVQEVEIFSSDGTTDINFILEFDLTDICTTEIDTTCCADSVTIRWIGREGGIKSWSFPGVREFDVKVGDANTYIDGNRRMNYSERKGIYYGRSVSTGNISRANVDFLDELRYSIQAWEEEDGEVTPILLDNDSFFKYKTRDKLFDLTFRYIVSEEVQIQTQ